MRQPASSVAPAAFLLRTRVLFRLPSLPFSFFMYFPLLLVAEALCPCSVAPRTTQICGYISIFATFGASNSAFILEITDRNIVSFHSGRLDTDLASQHGRHACTASLIPTQCTAIQLQKQTRFFISRPISTHV